MIQSLTPQAFREYGTILPAGQQVPSYCNTHSVALLPQQAVLYETTADTWLRQEKGSVIVSVSPCDDNYRDFYLDQPLRLHGGVRFRLVTLEGAASVELAAFSMPRHLEVRAYTPDFALRPRLRVESIVTFFYQEKEQGFLFPGESHPTWELTYVDSGSLHSVADGQDRLLNQGDLVFYKPGQWHMQYADIGVAPRFVTVSFHLSGAVSTFFDHPFSATGEVSQLLRQMLRAQDGPWGGDRLLTLLQLLLLTLLESGDNQPQPVQGSHALNAENQTIRQAQQYIAGHVREKLSVPVVAKRCDVSPSYLTALFQKHLAISPGEYIRRLKLQESKQMIREGTLNFTQIAEALQYSTVHHFSRQFKEKFGITPTEYAKSVR